MLDGVHLWPLSFFHELCIPRIWFKQWCPDLDPRLACIVVALAACDGVGRRDSALLDDSVLSGFVEKGVVFVIAVRNANRAGLFLELGWRVGHWWTEQIAPRR